MAEVSQGDDPAHDAYVLLSAVSDVERAARMRPKDLATTRSHLEEAYGRLGAVLATLTVKEAA